MQSNNPPPEVDESRRHVQKTPKKKVRIIGKVHTIVYRSAADGELYNHKYRKQPLLAFTKHGEKAQMLTDEGIKM